MEKGRDKKKGRGLSHDGCEIFSGSFSHQKIFYRQHIQSTREILYIWWLALESSRQPPKPDYYVFYYYLSLGNTLLLTCMKVTFFHAPMTWQSVNESQYREKSSKQKLRGNPILCIYYDINNTNNNSKMQLGSRWLPLLELHLY